jgi:hypothetical protein
MAIHHADVNTLVIAGDAETPEGTLYEIGVERGPCGHIIDFVGEAKEVAMTPHVSDLLFVSGGLLFYTEWPKNHIAQLLPGASMPDLRTDLGKLGITMSAGGFGLVPPGIEGAGQLRMLTWDTGDWYHLDRSANGELFDLGNAVKITQGRGEIRRPRLRPGGLARLRRAPCDAQRDGGREALRLPGRRLPAIRSWRPESSSCRSSPSSTPPTSSR